MTFYDLGRASNPPNGSHLKDEIEVSGLADRRIKPPSLLLNSRSKQKLVVGLASDRWR
jgi:hypothetical protein